MTEKIGRNTIELYESIENLPITRFQMYNLNLMMDAGIGSDLNAFNTRIQSLRQLVRSEDKEAAQLELTNLQTAVTFIMSKTSPEMRSFAVMVKSINGKKVNDSDLTDEGINRIIKTVSDSGGTMKWIRSIMNRIKKKLDFEFEQYFPDLTNSSSVKEFYSKLKAQTLLKLENIYNPSEKLKNSIADIDKFLMSFLQPKMFHGSEGVEVATVKSFEDSCSLLIQHKLTTSPKIITTLSFFQKLELLKSQLKKQQKK